MISSERLIEIQKASFKARKRYFLSYEESCTIIDSLGLEQRSRFVYAWVELDLNWCNALEDSKGTFGEFWYHTLNDIEAGKEIKVSDTLRNWTLYRAAFGSYLQDRLNQEYGSEHLGQDISIWKK